MTRRLAKETIFKEGIDKGVDLVFTKIESRICENCKYDTEVLNCKMNIVRPSIFIENSQDYIKEPKFGCTKFKRK